MIWSHYYLTSCKFFTPVLSGGLSLEFKWQQISSCLPGSCEYSIQSRFPLWSSYIQKSLLIYKYISTLLTSKMNKLINKSKHHAHVSLEKKATLTRCCLNNDLQQMNKTRHCAVSIFNPEQHHSNVLWNEYKNKCTVPAIIVTDSNWKIH